MLKFEEYIQQFNSTISLFDFVVGLILTSLLAMLIRVYYIRYGEAVSNRRRFANNFLPLALTTMLIITIVKSSIALSLGLVGALSIVRFRAAIKDPEELTYLFLTIGLGLSMGANQFMVGLISVPAIILLLFIHKRMTKGETKKQDGRMYVNIETESKDLEGITKLLSERLPYVELKRMDAKSTGMSISYIVKSNSIKDISELRNSIMDMSGNAQISFVEQPDLIL